MLLGERASREIASSIAARISGKVRNGVARLGIAPEISQSIRIPSRTGISRRTPRRECLTLIILTSILKERISRRASATSDSNGISSLRTILTGGEVPTGSSTGISTTEGVSSTVSSVHSPVVT